VVVSRTRSQLDASKERIEALGRKCLPIEMDVSDAAAVRAMADEALRTFGKVDILVSNAAPPSVVAPIENLPLEKWRHIQAVNVEGTILLLQALGPQMLQRGRGNVIVVSSTLGMNGNPNSAAYGASKAALNHLTRTVAAEWGPRGVRVNALVPGPVNTERVKAVTSNQSIYDELVSMMPLRRFPVAEDMVGPCRVSRQRRVCLHYGSSARRRQRTGRARPRSRIAAAQRLISCRAQALRSLIAARLNICQIPAEWE